MNLVEILFNAAGGGVVGSALHCLTDWIDTKNKIALMNAQVAAAEKTEAWKAFAASQGDAGPLVVPAGVPSWVSSCYVLAFTLKEVTRPALTWASIGLITFVYTTASPATRDGMTPELMFGAFTAIFWYFGARYAKGK
jgi:hypothetical protein